MKRIVTSAAFTAALLSATATAAPNDYLAAGIHAGTLGPGIDIAYNLSEKLNVRGVINSFNTDYDDQIDDFDYDFDADLQTAGLMLDWHLFSGGFRVTGGVLINNNELQGTATPQGGGSVEFGGQTFNASDFGDVTASVKFEEVTPYLGIGWGNLFNGSRLSFTVDAGVVFQGTPEADISATAAPGAPAGTQALLDSAIDDEIVNVQNDLDNFELYPLIQVGLTYRF